MYGLSQFTLRPVVVTGGVSLLKLYTGTKIVLVVVSGVEPEHGMLKNRFIVLSIIVPIA